MADAGTAPERLSHSDVARALNSIEREYFVALDEKMTFERDHGIDSPYVGLVAYTQADADTVHNLEKRKEGLFADIVSSILQISRENPELSAFDVECWLRSTGARTYLVARPFDRRRLGKHMTCAFGSDRACKYEMLVVATEKRDYYAGCLIENGSASEEDNRQKLERAGFLSASRPLSEAQLEEDVRNLYGPDERVTHIAPSKGHPRKKRGRGRGGKRGR